MRRSSKLFINVLGFALNFSAATIFALAKIFPIVFFCLLAMFISYQGIYDVMTLLDANESERKDEAED